MSDESTILSSRDSTLSWYNPENEKCSMVKVLVSGKKQATVSNQKKIQGLSSIIDKNMRETFKNKYGTQQVYNLFIGNLTIVDSVQEQRKSDEDLINELISLNTETIKRMKFAPSNKTNLCKGLYYCNPDSNTWSREHNMYMEDLIMDMFSKMTLSKRDYRHVMSRRGRADMLHILASKTLDDTFAARLDSNVDIFVLENSCLDSRTTRQLTPEDSVSMTAGWSYCPELASSKRSEVDEFLKQVFPIEEERSIVLAFFASLLSGKRTTKKFLALTDKRSGNNGKSTVVDLFMKFFGSYSERNTKFVCKGSFDKDRDSHDAGLSIMRGKRLIVADKLKESMTLDDALLRRLAGGICKVKGRLHGSSDQFEFQWQAGFVLIFNEGDCPKFDSANTAFMNRMIVAPMTSPVDYDIQYKFEATHTR
jgi:phage/plasmid-associated DNA primase